MKDLAGALDLGMLLKARVRLNRRDMKYGGARTQLLDLMLRLDGQVSEDDQRMAIG